MISKEVTETKSILAYHDDAVPDPDLEIRGRGGGSSRPLDRGGEPSQKNVPFRPQFGLKIKEGPAPSLDPPL